MVDAGERGTHETQSPEFQGAERKLNFGESRRDRIDFKSILLLVLNESPGGQLIQKELGHLMCGPPGERRNSSLLFLQSLPQPKLPADKYLVRKHSTRARALARGKGRRDVATLPMFRGR
jgi:hypothetical protein